MIRNLTASIASVGIDDPGCRLFENQYATPKGMSYNSYLIIDRHTAILDSVEPGAGPAWIRRIEDLTSGVADPEYLVVHHVEPDHTAGIALALDRWPQLTIVGSAKAIAMLPQFFPGRDFSGRTMAVKEGDTLQLGDHSLRFFSAPMIHWPEVMVSYEEHEHILFSADAFGKFGALQFDDNWVDEARRYYINIVGRYGNQVQSLLKKLQEPHISAIAPLHGPVIRGNLSPFLKLYDTWSSYRPESRGVLVAYASIYGATAEAALRLAEMLRRADVGLVVEMDLCNCDQSEAVAQAFRLSSMVVAAPTYDGSIYPPMHDFLYHLALKNYRNRRLAIIENGSWAPTAGRQMRAMLEQLPGIEFIDPMVTLRSRLTEQSLTQLTQLANNFKL